MNKQPYAKALGFSLLFHIALLLVLTIGYNSLTSVSVAAPIEIEFIAASVSFSETATDAQPDSSQLVHQPIQGQIAVQPVQEKHIIEQEFSQQETSGQAEVKETILPQLPKINAKKIDEGDGSGTDNGGGNERQICSKSQGSDYVKIPAQYLSGSRPAYPRDAWRKNREGIVVIRVHIGVTGTIKSADVHSGSGYEALDNAALQAVREWRFAPARHGINAVESYHDVRINFRLADWK